MSRPLPKGPLIAAALALVVVAALVASAWASMRRKSDETLCATRLRTLYIAVRSGELLDSPKWDAAPRGRAFIAFPDRWPGRQARDVEVTCPVKGTNDDIDYRGPALPFRELKNGDPVFADRVGNHGPGKGGNVCAKDGTVTTCGADHALWARAAATTAD